MITSQKDASNDNFNFITSGLPDSCTLGRCWHVVITRSDFKSGTVLDSSAQTTWGMLLDFFVKSQKGLVWPVSHFVFFVSVFCLVSIFELKIDVLVSRTRITSVNVVCNY